MSDTLILLAGVICAGVGGELFVRGIVGIAHWARVSPAIVATTLAAFATSSPELTVAVNSALAGAPEISLGDALGSNVVNVALILALAALIAPIAAPRDSVKRDFPVTLLVPVLVGALSLDGMVSRMDGVALLSAFLIWLLTVLVEARRQRSSAEKVLGESRGWLAATLCVAGLALLIVAGRLIVVGAQGIAAAFGIDPFIIGATLVAVGTSVPELATAIVSQLRRHGEVGLGTVLGSNVFNALFIIGVAATITPIRVAWNEVSLTLLFGIATVAVTFPGRRATIGRGRGLLLLVLYVLYVTLIIAPMRTL
jgi:cation:H+ antiporter